MSKRNKIIYWIATLWLAFGMSVTGVFQIIQYPEEVAKMETLGYAGYVMILIGVWKILGSIVIILPMFPLIKEWAYAGFFFVMTGAIFSHLAKNDPLMELFGPTLLLFLTVISWYFRPADRKLIS